MSNDVHTSSVERSSHLVSDEASRQSLVYFIDTVCTVCYKLELWHMPNYVLLHF